MAKFSVDLCIVSGRRPDLLEQTLESFSKHCFAYFSFSKVTVNIDPIFGTEEDEAECLRIVSNYLPSVTFFRPREPGFGAAVKRLWANTRSDYVFHLEDDWIALTDLGDEIFAPFANDPAVMQVSFHTADQNWNIAKHGHLHERNEYARVLGVKIPLFRTFPKFTTSPSILRGSFARKASGLMDPSRDPEKQFYSGVNAELERLAAPHKNYIFSPLQTPVIRDIGREWRGNRKIKKVIENTTSYWIEE